MGPLKTAKIKRFHQFIRLDRGPVNTALIDFLKGDIFQVENKAIDAFENRKYQEVPELVTALEAENMIIQIDENKWVPQLKPMSDADAEELPISLELEEGIDLQLIKTKFRAVEITKIVYFGNNAPKEIISLVEVIQKDKAEDFAQCQQQSTVRPDSFTKISAETHQFNSRFNSCWGKKLAVTKEGLAKPCIHSDIVMGDLNKESVTAICEKATAYWQITKDKIAACKSCEMRYSCFDCRVIAQNKNNNLFDTNPNCSYDPYNGTWDQ